MCIASQVGATITEAENGRLFSEDPHRLIAVMGRGAVDLPEDFSRKVGTVGGASLILGDSDPVDVRALTEKFEGAIPRRMAG
jgi:hypothetical protein